MIIADNDRWRRDLLHAEFWWNTCARLQFVAIATAATSASLLGRRRQRNISADVNYRAQHLSNLHAMHHHLVRHIQKQSQRHSVQQYRCIEVARLNSVGAVSLAEERGQNVSGLLLHGAPPRRHLRGDGLSGRSRHKSYSTV